MGLFKKLFCSHKWKTHGKHDLIMSYYDTVTSQKMPYTKDFTREILICENCGKIKKIEY